MATKNSITSETFPGEYGPWEAATGPVNVQHDANQHPYEGDPNEWSIAERVASRKNCNICRVVFTADGLWRAEGPSRRTAELSERENRTTHRAPKTARPTQPASEKQIEWLDKNFANKQHTYSDADLAAGKADRRKASEMLDVLFAAPYKPRETKTADRVTEDGMYRNAAGDVFKVQIAKQGSGNLYAKALVIDAEAVRDEEGTIVIPAVVRFEYASGAITRLTPAMKMSLEEAKAFGALYGVCCRCGADLTDEGSIAAGIGPVCASKF